MVTEDDISMNFSMADPQVLGLEEAHGSRDSRLMNQSQRVRNNSFAAEDDKN